MWKLLQGGNLRKKKSKEIIKPQTCKECRKCKIKNDILGDCLDLEKPKLNVNINASRICKNFLGGK